MSRKVVDAYYENGAFYVITYALSNGMKHMEEFGLIEGEYTHGKITSFLEIYADE